MTWNTCSSPVGGLSLRLCTKQVLLFRGTVCWLHYIGKVALVMELLAVVALVIASGLLAGFFFAWWCSCMLGLRHVGDDTFVEAMQAINGVLPNGRFAIPFFTPVVLAAISTWVAFTDGESAAGWWSLAAAILSVVTFGITAAGSVPLNNGLEAAGRENDAAAREAFEGPWTRLNDIRTLTSVLAFCAGVAALVSWT